MSDVAVSNAVATFERLQIRNVSLGGIIDSRDTKLRKLLVHDG